MQRPKLLGYGDVAEFLDISKQRLNYLIDKYGIPNQKTSSGRIFFEQDIISFKAMRQDKMKHKRNVQ